MATVRENLIAAKALIDTPEKWGKGAYEPSPGCFCILGALFEASGRQTAYGAPYDAIERQLPWGNKSGIVKFNDAPETTHADIMALFDRAIAAQVEA